MRLNYLKSYDRSFEKLTSPQQENSIKAIDALIEFIKTGKKPQGLGGEEGEFAREILFFGTGFGEKPPP